MGTIADSTVTVGLEGTVWEVSYEVLRGRGNEDYLVCTQWEREVGGEVIAETTGLATVLPPA
jgi:hypothetical protein